MKVNVFYFILSFFSFLNLFIRNSYAIDDPVSMENNKYGVHIFDINEVDKVADLVNSNGGEWGYVTVPIREDQRDRAKWQEFMRKCNEKKLIPIVRLATEMKTYGWAKPSKFTSIDYANFLNDLDWPTVNRYIIVYNEPNHASEWGSEVNPEEYVDELAHTIRIFKERNDDFYMLPAGLDAAAPNASGHMRWDVFLARMNARNPEALKSIDGWNSHSYPNHAFSGKPTDRHDHSVISFMYETNLIKKYTGKDLPIFITETGWSNEKLSDDKIAEYYRTVFSTVWNDNRIIAITPFVLNASAGPFEKFSLMDKDGNPKPQYKLIASIVKKPGRPTLDNEQVNTYLPILGVKDNKVEPYSTPEPVWGKDKWYEVWKWFKKEN